MGLPSKKVTYDALPDRTIITQYSSEIIGEGYHRWLVPVPFYLHQGGYVFAWVCLSVCLLDCEQDNSKTYGRILITYSGYV